MNKVAIKTSGRFRVLYNNKELPFSKESCEFLALLTLMGGSKVTAKSEWETIYKEKGRKFCGCFYSQHAGELQEELRTFGLSDIISFGKYPVRSCRLMINSIECDYYDMLSGEGNIIPKEQFVPEYKWAKKLYFENWEQLRMNTRA